MSFLLLAIPLLLILIVIGTSQNKGEENGEYMINVEWMTATDKFKLIARWGVK